MKKLKVEGLGLHRSKVPSKHLVKGQITGRMVTVEEGVQVMVKDGKSDQETIDAYFFKKAQRNG